jgi:hypothetical protein
MVVSWYREFQYMENVLEIHAAYEKKVDKNESVQIFFLL